MTKRAMGQICAFLLAATLPAIAHAQDSGSAQDVGTTTPPELRDFRLDPPPTRPGPEQSPEQPAPTVVQPPPVAPTTEAAPRSEARPAPRGDAAAPRTNQDRGGTRSATTAADQISPPPTLPPAEVQGAPSESPTITSEAAPLDAAADEQQSAVSSADWSLYAWIGGAIALLAALLAGGVAWRRRQSRIGVSDVVHDVPALQPSPPARLNKPRPALPAKPAPKLETTDTPALSVQFAPTSAQLSIASLTVTGQLTLQNRATSGVTQLALRSQMISAQDGQRDAIAAFHANKADGEIQPLGDLAAGERIDAIIEIRLPRTELHAFRWTEREFVAPIILVNVTGVIDDQPVEARLAQLIGREGLGTSPRMKPLAIDRGPKRYSGIEARPVFA